LTKMTRDPAFTSVADQCRRALRSVEWRMTIDALRANARSGGSLRIAAGMLRSPRERMTRFALGALRRELARDGRTLLARLKR
jgi:hypothetical protein